MKKFLLFASAAVLALSAAAESNNGKVVNGELILEDFEGEAPQLYSRGVSVKDEFQLQDIHLCDNGIKEFKGTNCAWVLNAYRHRLASDPAAQGPWGDDAPLLFVKVSIPAGKTLADFTGITVDFANYDGETSANNYHKIFITKDPSAAGSRAEAYKYEWTNDETISDGEFHTIHSVWDEDYEGNMGWGCIPFFYDEWTSEEPFYVGYAVQHNLGGFYIDNIRLTGDNLGGVAAVTTDNDVAVYPVANGVRVLGTTPVNVYSIDGKLIVSENIEGEGFIDLTSGCYIVRANGKATKVLVK